MVGLGHREVHVFAWLALIASITVSQENNSGPNRTQEFVEKGWSFEVPANSGLALKRLGKPVAERREKVKNLHVDGQMDDLISLEYAGLQLDYYRAADREFLTRVEVRDPRRPVKLGLRVGEPAAKVAAALGEGTAKDGWNCFASESGFQEACFSVLDGKIQAVRWSIHLD